MVRVSLPQLEYSMPMEMLIVCRLPLQSSRRSSIRHRRRPKDPHFGVGRTMIRAWASDDSFVPTDDTRGR